MAQPTHVDHLDQRDTRQRHAQLLGAARFQAVHDLQRVHPGAFLLADDGTNVQLTGQQKGGYTRRNRAAMWAIASSGITPGPLGILETNPSAAAPASIAISASSGLLMQQIFTLGLCVARILSDTLRARAVRRGTINAQPGSK